MLNELNAFSICEVEAIVLKNNWGLAPLAKCLCSKKIRN